MQKTTDRCKQLRKLQRNINEELRALKETLRDTEDESFENPLMEVNVIKRLQETLHTINEELAQCPPEE